MSNGEAGASWWLDELTHAGPEHLDAEYVSTYTVKAGVDPAEDIEALIARGLGAGSTIVDLGAGTGVFAVAAAAVAGQVIATDISPAMVDALTRRTRELRLDNVSVVHAGLLSYRHQGRPADFVYSRNVFHQIPDFWKTIALDRVHSMLAPGGILRVLDLVYDFEPSDTAARMDAWFAGAVEDPARGWTAEELAGHVRTEHSTFTWLFEPMLERTGFEILDRQTRRGAYGTYTCRRT